LFSSTIEPSLTSSFQELENTKQKNILEKLQDLWHERSGTSEILALKESVNEASSEFDQASAKVTFARRHVDDSLRKWERTSGQHLQLLQRRESWDQNDAQEFANLVAREITCRNELEQARESLARAEETLSKKQLEYMNRMRRRYHEEQIWQDQWRVLGTYGTWSLIVLNSCVFLASQYFLRLRENSRMKAIEELIRDNTAAIVNRNNEFNQNVHDSTFTAATTAHVDDRVVMVQPADTDELVRFCNAEVEHQELLNAETNETVKEETQDVHNGESTIKDSRSATKTMNFVVNKEQLLLQLQQLNSKEKPQWQTVQTKFNEVKAKVISKTEQIVASLPDYVVGAVPKSPSEIHIPSAIIGSAATGVVIVLFMSLFPSHRK
jgi:hypothetical protein